MTRKIEFAVTLYFVKLMHVVGYDDAVKIFDRNGLNQDECDFDKIERCKEILEEYELAAESKDWHDTRENARP